MQKFHLCVLPVSELKQINCSALPLEQILRKDSFPLHRSYPSAVLHSYVRHPASSIKCVTSLIEPKLTLKHDKNLYVIASSIQTTQPDQTLRLEGSAYLINMKVDLNQVDISTFFSPYLLSDSHSGVMFLDSKFFLERQHLHDWLLNSFWNGIENGHINFFRC